MSDERIACTELRNKHLLQSCEAWLRRRLKERAEILRIFVGEDIIEELAFEGVEGFDPSSVSDNDD